MRKISFVLSIVMIFNIFSFAAFAKSDIEIILNHPFDDIETGGKPGGMSNAEYGNVAVVDKRADGKHLLMRNRDAYNQVNFNMVTSEKTIFIETRVMLEDWHSEKSITISGEDIVVFSGNATLVDRGVGVNAKRHTWHDVKIRLNTNSKRYDVYVDGKLAGERARLSASSITSIGFKSNETGGAQTSFLVDYLRVYAASTFAKASDFPSAPYNPKEKYFVKDVDEIPQTQTIYANNINETAFGSIPGGMQLSGNVRVQADESGNKFLHALRDNNTQILVDIILNKNLYKVVFQADIKNETEQGSSVFVMRDTNAKFMTPMQVRNGYFIVNGKTIRDFRCNEDWVNVAIAVNFLRQEYDVYLNHTLISEGNKFSNLSSNINLTRFQMWPDPAVADVKIDNIDIYTGTKPKEKEEEPVEQTEQGDTKSSLSYDEIPINADVSALELIVQDKSNAPSPIFDDFSEMLERMKHSIAFVADNDKMMAAGEKYRITQKPYFKNGVLYIPLRLFADVLRLPASWDSSSNAFVIDGVSFADGATAISGKLEEIALDYPIEIKDGTMFAPAQAVGDALDLFTIVTEAGLAAYAKYILPIETDKFNKVTTSAFNYIVYDRPNTETLWEKFQNNAVNTQRPRVAVSVSELEVLKERVQTDPLYKAWSDNTIADAEKYPFFEPIYTFDSAGIRLRVQISSRDVLKLFWAWYMTGNNEFYEKAKMAILATARFSDWNPSHFLDTASYTLAAATMYDCFYNIMDEETKDTIANAIINNGLKPAYESYYGKGISKFPQNTNNWNVICNGGIASGALALMDEYETQLCLDILEKGLKSSEIMMTQFAPNGAWFEGPSYWHYMIQNMVPYFDALIRVFGDDFGLMDVPGMKETGYFLPNISGNTGAFAFHDTTVYYRGNIMELFWFAKYNKDPYLARLRLNEMEKYGYKGTILDMLYYDSSLVADEVNLPLDMYYSVTEVATSRSGWDANAAFMAVHAGYNEVAHGQLDMGTFEYEVFGKRYATDNGLDDYNMQGYFDTNHGTRYSYYVNRTEAHNLYVINPSTHGGQERYVGSKITVVENKDDGSIYTVDLTPAYSADVVSALRGYKLDQDRMVFTVQDEIVPSRPGDEYQWFWHTAQKIEILDDKTILLGTGATTVKLHIEADFEYEVDSMPSLPLPTSPDKPNQLGGLNTSINKICIKFYSEDKPMKLRVTAVPYGKTYLNEPLSDISEWKIADKQVFENPAKVDAIMVDGSLIDSFSPDTNYYYLKTSDIMTVSATASDMFNIEVAQATRENPFATVMVQDKNNIRNTQIYIIEFDISIEFGAEKPTGQRHVFKNVTASAVPEPANVPENVFDGNLSTRWASQGDQHLIIDLEQTKNISAIGIAIYQGTERVQNLAIYYSGNGEDYKLIAPAKTSGKTQEVEYATFETVQARWIKIEFSGNSQNAWNSITELEIYE